VCTLQPNQTAQSNHGRLKEQLKNFTVSRQVNSDSLLVPAPGTARHVSWCFRGRRDTAIHWAEKKP
jgi:hypothetical protein